MMVPEEHNNTAVAAVVGAHSEKMPEPVVG